MKDKCAEKRRQKGKGSECMLLNVEKSMGVGKVVDEKGERATTEGNVVRPISCLCIILVSPYYTKHDPLSLSLNLNPFHIPFPALQSVVV